MNESDRARAAIKHACYTLCFENVKHLTLFRPFTKRKRTLNISQLGWGDSSVWVWPYDHVKISYVLFSSVHSLSVMSDPMDCSMPGFPVHQQLLELTQLSRWCHPLSSSSPAFNLSQHQGLFHWVSSSHQVAKVLEFQLQHQSFQWTPRTVQDGLAGSPCSSRDSQESSSSP